VDGGWRLPAAEIERSIAAAAQSILDDQQTVISAVEEAGLDSSRIAPLLKSAAVCSARLRFEQDNALSSLIDRIDLDQDGMRLSIKLQLSNAENRNTRWFESSFDQASCTITGFGLMIGTLLAVEMAQDRGSAPAALRRRAFGGVAAGPELDSRGSLIVPART
jgi:hypothetical protein